MLSREDFVFTIGYDGPAAVVDKQAKRKYGKLPTQELVEKGLFRAAYSSAVYSGKQEELEFVARAFKGLGKGDSPGADNSAANALTDELSEADLSAMDRLFGVFIVDVKRSIYI